MFNIKNYNQYDEYEISVLENLHYIITETIKLWFNHDSRDSKKVNFLHENLIVLLNNYINHNKYAIIQEWKVAWKFLDKDCDIVIVNKKYFSTNDGSTIQDLQNKWKWWKTVIISWVEEVISVKNPIASYKKNAANYMEALIWEAVNLKEVWIRYSHFMFISDTLPIYKNTFDDDGNSERELIRKEEIWKKEIETFKKIKWLSIIDDFVTFFFNVKRYDDTFNFSSELIDEDPWITLYIEDIPDIKYTFYFFEFLDEFYERYN